MKELHNDIFSNTTCISKETMLRYINKQLSKSELHKVEKHMLDCELCSEAYEGMQLAQNSSMLFTIDNQIDQRIRMGNSKAPVMRSLMVAASILVIVFGAYFTFNYFNNTLNNESELAITEVDESIQEGQPIEEEAILKEKEVKAQGNLATKEGKLLDMLEDDEEFVEDGKYRTTTIIPDPVFAEQAPEINDIVSYDMEDEMAEVEEEVVVTAKLARERDNKAKGESDKLLESLDDANTTLSENRREDNFDSTLKSESSTSNNFAGVAANEPAADKSGESLKKEAKKEKSKTPKRDSKKRFKSNAQAPAYNENVAVEETIGYSDGNQQKILVIDSYKVVDYTEEYQEEYDLKNANNIETKSVSAGFESKADKDEAEKEKDEITLEVTYKETLIKAIKLYKSKKYTQAIAQFNIILAKHPNEVNGLFYEGMSNYHLQQYGKAKDKFDKVLINKETEFNQEANWYKALSLMELKETEKAKKVLDEIIKTNGFYKSKAKEKLKGLD